MSWFPGIAGLRAFSRRIGVWSILFYNHRIQGDGGTV